MKLENQIMDKFSQLATEDKHYILKVLCLLNFSTGFKKEFEKIIPSTGRAAITEQLDVITLLVNKWLYKEGYTGLLRAKLTDAGVEV